MSKAINTELKHFESSVYAEYRLHNFVQDESNQAAYNKTIEWVNAVKAGQITHLHIFGECGNGKTHLAAAAVHSITQVRKSVAAYVCDVSYLADNTVAVPADSILFCEGAWSVFNDLIEQIISSATIKNTSVICTTDKNISVAKNIRSAQILKPSVSLLQKVAAEKLKHNPKIETSPIIGGSVREVLHKINKEILRKEINSNK